MVLQAPAKVNLTLDIVGKREDGYHNVEMIMETVSLYDTITIEKASKIHLECNLPYVPIDERNIAYKCAKAFFEKSGISGGANIKINKRIPVAAGLAGGSTDGSTVLKGLNHLYGKPFNIEQLKDISGNIGADLPYCINGRPALAEGIGEKLTSLGNMPRTLVLLAKPAVSLSTKWVYSMINWQEIPCHPDTKGAIEALKKGDIKLLAEKMYNVLEPVSTEKYSIIGEIKNTMLKGGALGSIMSGSGPTVFGLFDDETKAKQTMQILRETCPFVYLGHTL
ncbi:MAG: 4-(cytidine 5'-diphospho)-2-C-methyl-D-erythritol kinase [Clostridia bacterium]|nr:4-(cytidine 5'-diphospho)-2-C-methyl-D-erythritol kinase [Clostridia bacterium]